MHDLHLPTMRGGLCERAMGARSLQAQPHTHANRLPARPGPAPRSEIQAPSLPAPRDRTRRSESQVETMKPPALTTTELRKRILSYAAAAIQAVHVYGRVVEI